MNTVYQNLKSTLYLLNFVSMDMWPVVRYTYICSNSNDMWHKHQDISSSFSQMRKMILLKKEKKYSKFFVCFLYFQFSLFVPYLMLHVYIQTLFNFMYISDPSKIKSILFTVVYNINFINKTKWFHKQWC